MILEKQQSKDAKIILDDVNEAHVSNPVTPSNFSALQRELRLLLQQSSYLEVIVVKRC